MTYRSTIQDQSGEDAIANALNEIGPLTQQSPVPPEVIKNYQGKVPALALDVWDNFGVGDLCGGRMRLCIPRSVQSAVDLLFEDDPYLEGDTYALAYGAFGDLIIWSERFQMVYVNMQLSSVEVPALIDPTQNGPADEVLLDGLLKQDSRWGDAFDDAGKEMFDRANEQYGDLPPLSLFGMIPPNPYDEPFNLANHRIQEVDEWLIAKISGATFRLDDPDNGRFGVRDIGPLPEGQTPVAPGEL